MKMMNSKYYVYFHFHCLELSTKTIILGEKIVKMLTCLTKMKAVSIEEMQFVIS